MLRIWKGPEAPTYLVQVGADLYEMDHNADRPDGLCSYVGKVDRTDGPNLRTDHLRETVPIGIARKAVSLCNLHK